MIDDNRIEKFAELIIARSLSIKKGDLFQINGNNLNAPLVREVYKKALERGAHPFIQAGVEGVLELFYRYCDEEQLNYVSPIDMFLIQNVSAVLNLYGGKNLHNLSSVEPNKQTKRSLALKPIADAAFERQKAGTLRRLLTIFPTDSEAQAAGMSLSQYTDYVFRTIKLDRDDPVSEWIRIEKEHNRIMEYLARYDLLEIKAPGTDLRLKVGGRNWVNCSGHRNLPDGEIFTGPIEDSADGYIQFNINSHREGHAVSGVRLVFRDGEVIEASADEGEEFLLSQINMDSGSKRIGEFSFGTNEDVDRLVGRILIDEKFGGAIHLALGRSLPNSGGVNKSALHWDFITDMRHGLVKGDGRVFYENGKFLL